jgi:NTP pyrophosphatase (non-canonical NTP hydrolase)
MTEEFDPKQAAAGFVEALRPMAESPVLVEGTVEGQIDHLLMATRGMSPAARVLLACALIEQIGPCDEKLTVSSDGILEVCRTVRELRLRRDELLAVIMRSVEERRARQARGQHILAWATETFGEVALYPVERAMRFFEESAEVAQAVGIPLDRAIVIVSSVYQRPVGELRKELGAAIITAECLAAAAKVDLEEVSADEWERIRSIDKAKMRARQQEKVAAGMAVSL